MNGEENEVNSKTILFAHFSFILNLSLSNKLIARDAVQVSGETSSSWLEAASLLMPAVINYLLPIQPWNIHKGGSQNVFFGFYGFCYNKEETVIKVLCFVSFFCFIFLIYVDIGQIKKVMEKQ